MFLSGKAALDFVVESFMHRKSRSVSCLRTATDSALTSEKEGLVLLLVHLVCGNIFADLSYLFISEKHLTTTLLFLLPWLDSFLSVVSSWCWESVAVDNSPCLHRLLRLEWGRN